MGWALFLSGFTDEFYSPVAIPIRICRWILEPGHYSCRELPVDSVALAPFLLLFTSVFYSPGTISIGIQRWIL